MLRKVFTVTLSFALYSASVSSLAMTLSSPDIVHGEHLSKTQEFSGGGFDCGGENLSPELSWSDAPEGTKYFAISVYDPDAPTGSGWWHWQVVNIPAEVSMLPAGAGSLGSKVIPTGSKTIENDYGQRSFGGACPPKGNGPHRYQFTVYALPKKLDLPENPSSALVGFQLNAFSLGSATIEAVYQRK
ncbi:YbhB/YbcL family Raf kinase inhibitor-like protein [Microbulbifer sp. SSSA002]|uniref:YbhB/YbcL family Raf kinase inhibitor-like protein n=1 Tax=Microbulbifer sp. SSSA002 TaxID=3243376 RepID=UPI004039E9A5